jgi:RimJ/RimL family protein N-acetyltransferase
MSVVLRPEQPADLPLLTGGDSPFDDFGPRPVRTTVRPSQLEGAGGLAIIDDDVSLAGDVTWHWNHWGPTPESRCPMIGIWLRPAARGRGIGRLAQRQLAELFFAHTGTNRVEAHTDVENVAEQRSLQAAGFRQEGMIRGAHWRAGAHRDGYLYSILRAELSPGRA